MAFEESIVNIMTTMVKRIDELEAKISKTEDPTIPAAEEEKQTEDLNAEQIRNIVDNYNI